MTVTEEIQQLKKEKHAVILAHYYVPEEVQQVADYIGDSYYLSQVAAKSDAEILVFCGVSFMGESAKILNPAKKVLMPDLSADCAMAHMAQIEAVKKMREAYEDLAVVCEFNSRIKGTFRCLRDIVECGKDREESSESEYLFYSGRQSWTLRGRAGAGKECDLKSGLLSGT